MNVASYYARCGALLGSVFQVRVDVYTCAPASCAVRLTVAGGVDCGRQASDDHIMLQDLFLRSHHHAAELMLMPDVTAIDPATGEQESGLPPSTLTLRPDRVVTMDCFTHLLVWSGAHTHTTSDERGRVLAALRSACGVRLPEPSGLHFTDGASMARYLVSRLAPIHHDAPELRVAAMPSLARMTPEEVDAFMERLSRSRNDTWGFGQYLRVVR